MKRLLISVIVLFVMYLARFVIGLLFSYQQMPIVLILILKFVIWALWLWVIIEGIILIRKSKQNQSASSLKQRKYPSLKRLSISVIVLIVVGFYSFMMLFENNFSSSTNQILGIIFSLVVSTLAVWVIIEGIILIKKDRDARPLATMFAFFAANVLFMVLLQVVEVIFGDWVSKIFPQGVGIGFFLIPSIIIFPILEIWVVVKGVALIKEKERVGLGVVSLIVGVLAMVISLWFIFGAIGMLFGTSNYYPSVK